MVTKGAVSKQIGNTPRPHKRCFCLHWITNSPVLGEEQRQPTTLELKATVRNYSLQNIYTGVSLG